MKTIRNLRGVVAALCMSLVALSATAGSNKMDIVDTAVKAEIFETLVAAVTAAVLLCRKRLPSNSFPCLVTQGYHPRCIQFRVFCLKTNNVTVKVNSRLLKVQQYI